MNKTFVKIFAVIFAVALISSQFWSCSSAQRLSTQTSTGNLPENKATVQPLSGINFVLKVDLSEKFLQLSPESDESSFQRAFLLAKKNYQNSETDFLTLFGDAFQQVAPGQLLGKYFINTDEIQNQINLTTPNLEVLAVVRKVINTSVEQTHLALKKRVDSLDLSFTAVLLDKENYKITIKIGGVQDLKRFKDYLLARGSLEFWGTYNNDEIYSELVRLHNELKKRGLDDNGDSVLLFKLLNPMMPTEEGFRLAKIGEAEAKDLDKTNHIFASGEALKILPQGLRFVWGPSSSFGVNENKAYHSLYALNTNNRGPPMITGDQIRTASASLGYAQQ